ncbi:MAG: NAD(P)H-dependent oxidoreductase [Spirochaetes bacterium]|nr:NAD(P)H-dependent oxidoreductase [Spirochaetota bacterium]
MRLLLLNGSPRGTAGNTAILLKHFTEGFLANNNNSAETGYLKRAIDHRKLAEKFTGASAVIIAFPLYADSMPGIVKDFIETLGRVRGKGPSPKIGFIVQSGFPEAVHSRYVEKYLEKLARRLDAPYLGTVIRGGVEGIQAMPPFMTRRLFMAFRSLGRHFGVTKEFHPIIVKKLAAKERLSMVKKAVFRACQSIGLTNMYWNMMLKKNGAFERRFDRPYQP